jgi:hypothetical protein
MQRYRVCISVTAYYHLKVRAEAPEHAEQAALKAFLAKARKPTDYATPKINNVHFITGEPSRSKAPRRTPRYRRR